MGNLKRELGFVDASLRARLNKIMASDYFTTMPEMKGPVEVAAAAGNYAPFQMPVPVQIEGSVSQFQQKVYPDLVFNVKCLFLSTIHSASSWCVLPF